MKEVLITLPSDRKVVMDKIIEKFSIPSMLFNFGSIIRYELKIPDDRTNLLLEELRAMGIGVAYGEILIKPVALFVSSDKRQNNIPRTSGINHDEVFANLLEFSTLTGEYLLMCFLAAVLASIGLLNDDSIVVIASMIVAPLLGPIAFTSLSLLSTETFAYVKSGLLTETVGILLTVVIGFLFGVIYSVFFPSIDPTNQNAIISRTALTIPALVLAIMGGLAAGVIIARGESTSIVGVAIAASLCPPAATVGILVSIGEWALSLGAVSLLIINILAINISCSAVFWLFDVRSHGMSKRQSTKVKKLNMIWVFIAALLSILIAIMALRN